MFSLIGIKIPWQVWACAGLIVVTAGWGELRHYQGKQKVQKEWDASIERGKGIVEGLKNAQPKITEKIVTVYQDRVKVVYEKGDTIEKLIPQYVAGDTCMLSPGFRVLHDASATNTIPGPSTRAAAQPVAVEDVAKVMNFNYTLCHAERAKLQALWQWAQEQRGLYLETCKQPGVNCSKDN
jgi:hypothetical protein